jgi:hypothetical protein
MQLIPVMAKTGPAAIVPAEAVLMRCPEKGA